MTALGPLTGPVGGAVARARHPAVVGGRPDPVGLARRLCDRFARAGYPVPDVAAALAATRGAWRVDRQRFAQLTGVPVEAVAAIESGEVDVESLPALVLVADPFAATLAALRCSVGSPGSSMRGASDGTAGASGRS